MMLCTSGFDFATSVCTQVLLGIRIVSGWMRGQPISVQSPELTMRCLLLRIWTLTLRHDDSHLLLYLVISTSTSSTARKITAGAQAIPAGNEFLHSCHFWLQVGTKASSLLMADQSYYRIEKVVSC